MADAALKLLLIGVAPAIGAALARDGLQVQPDGAWAPFRPPRIPALGSLLYPDPQRKG